MTDEEMAAYRADIIRKMRFLPRPTSAQEAPNPTYQAYLDYMLIKTHPVTDGLSSDK